MKGEPQPAEQARAGTRMADRYERLDIAMAMNDITAQASRDGGPIKPRPASRYEPAGSKAGRDETQIAGNRNGGGSEKVISARAVLTSSSQTTEDNRGGRDDARHGMTATEPKPTPLHQGNEAEPH